MTHSASHSRHARAGRLAAAALITIAAVSGIACAREPIAQAAVAATPGAGALPVAVNCGLGQQALIRPGFVNGQAISQVDCVATGATPTAVSMNTPMPGVVQASWPAASTPALPQSDVETVRVIERPVYRQAARPASYQTAEYAPERRVKSGRSWQKSALIIGSSAGIGAGVGGAVGGKKGALIGAAVGGGGATIWDQVTRR